MADVSTGLSVVEHAVMEVCGKMLGVPGKVYREISTSRVTGKPLWFSSSQYRWIALLFNQLSKLAITSEKTRVQCWISSDISGKRNGTIAMNKKSS